MKEILAVKAEESIEISELLTFLEALTEVYVVDPDNKVLKCLITYLPADIYEILSRCFPIISEHLGPVYKLIEKIFLLRLEAEERDIKLAQARIFFEERQFNEFWKKFHNHIISETPSIIENYLEKVVKTLHRLFLYEDYNYLSKMFQYATIVIIKFQDILQDGFLDLLGKVMQLKHDPSWAKKHSNAKEVPIWYIAAQEMVKISY